jgi:hypothetical protein
MSSSYILLGLILSVGLLTPNTAFFAIPSNLQPCSASDIAFRLPSHDGDFVSWLNHFYPIQPLSQVSILSSNRRLIESGLYYFNEIVLLLSYAFTLDIHVLMLSFLHALKSHVETTVQDLLESLNVER